MGTRSSPRIRAPVRPVLRRSPPPPTPTVAPPSNSVTWSLSASTKTATEPPTATSPPPPATPSGQPKTPPAPMHNGQPHETSQQTTGYARAATRGTRSLALNMHAIIPRLSISRFPMTTRTTPSRVRIPLFTIVKRCPHKRRELLSVSQILKLQIWLHIWGSSPLGRTFEGRKHSSIPKKMYIVQDTTSHIGGVWKIAKSSAALNRKKTRTATTDALLTEFGG
ncbi:putative RNase toxin 21 of polymorphic toxin system [Stackebrandtia endophytica]|uniref:Putative RNase toxin 21 of polymorphic toxin system n=1 Tax=Stackebrandtia endophytica TaxID=1496996 RepID=A0A543B1T2_9ACTN|nr:putative RNase toxin 21 of polymorphic toxin system [Stackebrandtia endophytica]